MAFTLTDTFCAAHAMAYDDKGGAEFTQSTVLPANIGEPLVAGQTYSGPPVC